MGKIIRSREMGNRLFKSEFIDGFSEGKWKINKIVEPQLPSPNNKQDNHTSPLVKRNELFIELPSDNYQHMNNDDFGDDFKYIHKVANEIKHFPDDITRAQVKSL